MPEDFEKLKARIVKLETLLAVLIFSDRYIFSKDIQLQDGRNVQLSTGTGTKIGTATGQKIGFLNATPVARQSAITAPTGGGTIDAEARTAINTIITVLETFGFVAPN